MNHVFIAFISIYHEPHCSEGENLLSYIFVTPCMKPAPGRVEMSERQNIKPWKNNMVLVEGRSHAVTFPLLLLTLPSVSDTNTAETVAALSQKHRDMRRPQWGDWFDQTGV